MCSCSNETSSCPIRSLTPRTLSFSGCIKLSTVLPASLCDHALAPLCAISGMFLVISTADLAPTLIFSATNSPPFTSGSMLMPFSSSAPAIWCSRSTALSPSLTSPLAVMSTMLFAASDLARVVPVSMPISAARTSPLAPSTAMLGEYRTPPGTPPTMKPSTPASVAP